jgi:hypothetical protein
MWDMCAAHGMQEILHGTCGIGKELTENHQKYRSILPFFNGLTKQKALVGFEGCITHWVWMSMQTPTVPTNTIRTLIPDSK